MLTHSESVLDARRLRTRGADGLELGRDTTGFPTTRVNPVNVLPARYTQTGTPSQGQPAMDSQPGQGHPG